MSAVIKNCGTYTVELDYGATTNAFLLDDPVAGVLDSTNYFLNGSTLFVDITSYVKQVSIDRGRQNRFRDSTGQPSTATITIEDKDKYFSLVNTASPYYDSANSRLGFDLNSNVRISRNGVYLFTGVITAYNQKIVKPSQSLVTITCSDKLYVMNNIKTTTFTTTAQFSGARIGTVLDNANLFPTAAERDINTGIAKLGTAPIDESTSVLEYLQRINNSEQGRIFMKGNGVFAFDQRLLGELEAIEATISDAGGTAIPFTDFDIVNN
jgi:hypothetical protein